MRRILWRVLAWLVCLAPVSKLIITIAKRSKPDHLGDYMRRYWLIPFSWGLPFAIRVHHILRADIDPWLHDHPWSWRTIILRGWYREENAFGRLDWMVAGRTHAAKATELHRISAVSPQGCWTLYFMFGRKQNHWGFMVGDPARKVHYSNLDRYRYKQTATKPKE